MPHPGTCWSRSGCRAAGRRAAPRVELSGDSDCVLATPPWPASRTRAGGVPWPGTCGTWSTPRRSRWIVPVGGERPPGPAFADQLPLWAAGRLAEVVTDWDRLTEDPAPLS